MASVNYTKPITRSASVKSSTPNTSYYGTDSVRVKDEMSGLTNIKTKALFYAADLPPSEGLILTNFTLHYKTHDVVLNITSPFIAIDVLSEAWTESGATYDHPETRQTYLSSNLTIGDIAVLADLPKQDYEKIRAYGIKIIDSSYGAFPGPVAIDVPIYSHLAAVEANRPYFTFTLSDSVPVATPKSPMRRFVDPSQSVVFAWEYANAVGKEQKSYVIETSTDGIAWTELVSAITADTTAVVAPNTIVANTKFWRIKVTSYYDIESEWSAPVQIVLVANPVCTINSVTSTPRPVIEWTCSDQQAYQVVCGSYDTGVVYGTEKTHKVATYLPDGETEIMVRAQGSLGLWSNWSKSTITIANTPGETINLSVYAQDHRARLSWSGGEGGTYYVLRDGVPIAKTTALVYVDEFAIGKHTYQVLEQLAGEYYTRSNTATITLKAKSKVISSVDSVAWLSLKYNLEQSPTIGESVQQSVVLTHYQGRKYPTAEGSEFVDKSMSFSVAFIDAADQAVFEALIGKTVCLKTRTGRMVIGLLSGFEIETGKLYSQFSATVTATDFVEEIAYD